MLLAHTAFLARVSVPASRRLFKEFAAVVAELEENPLQFPIREIDGLEGEYRLALFAKRYEAVFTLEGQTVYLDAVLDCRMEPPEELDPFL